MNALLFDTLRLSRTLRDKGHFAPEQADALAEALGEATHEDLVTKADLFALKSEMSDLRAELKSEMSDLRAELKAEIAQVKPELRIDIAELKADIAEVKADILKWIVGAIGFQTVAMLGTVVALVRIFAK